LKNLKKTVLLKIKAYQFCISIEWK